MAETPTPASNNPRKLSPMTILVGGFVGFLVLIAAFIGIASIFDREPSPENVLEPMLASQTMPDGSLLILKAATLGTTHEHRQPYPRRENSMFTATPEEAQMKMSVSEEQLGLWLEQFDQPSLQADDLTWWTKTSVLDELGNEVFDEDSARFIQYQYGSSTESGSRPYSPADRSNDPKIIAGLALFPMFRNSNETLTVRIYGSDPTPVAEFEIPNPMKAKSFPVWTPEPFPISKTISGVTMTLEAVQYVRKTLTNDAGVKRYQFKLEPTWSISENGVSITDGIVGSYVVSDALGDRGGNFNPDLPLDESAWKLSVPWRRNPQAVTDPGRTVMSGELTSPSPEQAPELLAESLRGRSSRISLLALGAGEQEIENLVSGRTGAGSLGAMGHLGGKPHSVNYDFKNRKMKLRIKSDLSWLVLKSEASPSEQVDLFLLDNNDQIVESQPIHAGELTVLIFDPPEGPVRLKAVVQEVLPFEFTFAPPEVVDE